MGTGGAGEPSPTLRDHPRRAIHAPEFPSRVQAFLGHRPRAASDIKYATADASKQVERPGSAGPHYVAVERILAVDREILPGDRIKERNCTGAFGRSPLFTRVRSAAHRSSRRSPAACRVMTESTRADPA